MLLGETTINPDDITQSVHAEFKRFSRRGANVVAAERTEKAVWRAIAEGRSVAVETVLSTDKYMPVVTAARARGYQTRLIFVAVADAERAIERVAIRRKAGGHGVPKAKIRSRWSGAHDNLLEFAKLVDEVLVFSNNTESPSLVAQQRGFGSPLVLRDTEALPEVTRRLRVRSR